MKKIQLSLTFLLVVPFLNCAPGVAHDVEPDVASNATVESDSINHAAGGGAGTAPTFAVNGEANLARAGFGQATLGAELGGGADGGETGGGAGGGETGGGAGGGETGGGAGGGETGGGAGGGAGGGTPDLWLRTQGNRILLPNGDRWHGRGANLHDTRGCDACTHTAPSVAEVNRRMDMLVDDWKANFIRLDLESYATPNGRVNWESFTTDVAYLANIKEIVAHALTKPGLYVMLSLWIDPTFTGQGWPTSSTTAAWQLLAAEFKDEPRVLFGLVNEPQSNFNGAQDAQVWAAMNSTVQAIRDVEGAGHKHLIAVQGTRAWSRVLDYYVTNPITAGGGQNVIYETHVYDPPSQYAALFENPARTLPVIIGEFGPASGFMTIQDSTELMQRARAAEVPHLAWTFHQRCPPNLIEETAPGCGINMPLRPTPWGVAFKEGLAQPW